LLLELLVIVALVVANGLLAAAEIAVVAVDKNRLRTLVEDRRRGARAVRALRADPERFFATVQVGITLVGVTAGAFGGATMARDLNPIVARLEPIAHYATEISVALVVGVISFLSLVIGELVPKSLALRHAERFALAIGPMLLALSSMSRPLVWVLTRFSNVVLRVFDDETTFSESRLSPDELRQLVEEATETGAIDATVGEIASRAFEFGRLSAAHVMIPRPKVVAIERHTSFAEVKRVALEHGFSRIPVYEGSLDELVGYVLTKDLLAIEWESDLFVLDDLLNPPFFVGESERATDLLLQMRASKAHMAFVRDDGGGIAGIVTLEDLLEELVGEIFSEHAEETPAPVSVEEDGSWLVPGDLPLRELNRATGLELAEGPSYSTVGGLCMALAGRVPEQDEVFAAADGTELSVELASERTVERVRVRRVTPAHTDSTVD